MSEEAWVLAKHAVSQACPTPKGQEWGRGGLQGSAPALGRCLRLVVRSDSARLHPDSAAWAATPQLLRWVAGGCPHP